MRLILDTNILIPLEDSQLPLKESLANFVRLAREHGHQLIYHPASEDDIREDTNEGRKRQTLDRLKQYTQLEHRPPCPWNHTGLKRNDAVDNEILYALECDAAHALVTEDKGIHSKAKVRSLEDRIYTIQTAEDWLCRLHEKSTIKLPNIEDVELYSLTPNLSDDFFNSLREGYKDFDQWFRRKSRDGTHAWVAWEQSNKLGAVCIYDQQQNEIIIRNGSPLNGTALKLCTFKVGNSVRGRKIGELFLKAAFRYATSNRIEYIFIHGDMEKQHYLFSLLEDFGFREAGIHPGSGNTNVVYLKEHPITPPKSSEIDSFEYLRRYYPHFRDNEPVSKFIVPIRPEFHEILFPDRAVPANQTLPLFKPFNDAGNAIKLAYLCHAQTKIMNPGDVVLFYRSRDEKSITSLGVVEEYGVYENSDQIARKVSRRTVYTMDDITNMAKKPTKVMLFRLIGHTDNQLSQKWLETKGVLKGPPQSITKISHESYQKILVHWK